jgi:AcrR family transcriptional regulator
MTADQANSTKTPNTVRERVLEVACELFAGAGFHGAHLREICKRAGTNVAVVCYHFQSKEGLYDNVIMEAGRRLSDRDYSFFLSQQLTPDQKLLMLVESLLERLGRGRASVSRLLARELADPCHATRSYVASGLERDFVLLQGVIRQLPVSKANPDIRLHALSVLGQCVFYSLAAESPAHPLNQQACGIPGRRQLASFLTNQLLRCLQNRRTDTEIPNL